MVTFDCGVLLKFIQLFGYPAAGCTCVIKSVLSVQYQQFN